jgi:hypothetical protein
MAERGDRQTHQLTDGSEIECIVRTSDSTVARIFEADLTRRMRSAQHLLGDTPPKRFRAFAAGRRTTHRSTTTHALPDGEVTVTIDASGTSSHEYLRSLVNGAVAYTDTLHTDVERAGALALLLAGCALALVAFGPAVLSVPFFGVAGVFALHLLLYWLSARGLAPSVSKVPGPDE